MNEIISKCHPHDQKKVQKRHLSDPRPLAKVTGSGSESVTEP